MSTQSLKKYKTILFDFDGTIADTFQIALDCANAVATKWGYAFLHDTPKLRDMSMKDIVLKKMGLKWYHASRFTRDVVPLLEPMYSKVLIFDNLYEVLHELKNEYQLGIVSSNKMDHITLVLKNNDLQIFDFIISDSSLFGKGRVLQKLIKTKSLERNRVLYVGDEVRDVDACNKIGIDIAAVTWGYNSSKVLQSKKPTFLFYSPTMLKEHLL